MTDRKRDLDELVGEAFAHDGELPAITEDEVERAEALGVEHQGDLPDSLLEYRPPAAPSKVVSLDEARRARSRAWLTHAAAAAIGAAAAAAVLVTTKEREPVGGTAMSSDTAVSPPDAAPPSAARIAIGAVRECAKPCCAGSSCAAAKPELRQCASGRACIGCSIDQLDDDRYRLRLSSFAPADPARKLLEGARGVALELCVQVGGSALHCVPAQSASGTEQWAALPLTVSAQDLVAGFLFQVRAPGVKKPLAEWRNAVRMDQSLLCRGLFIKPKTDKDETFGTVSVFLEDTYFVEIERSEDVLRLEEHGARFDFADVLPRVFETNKSGRERFVLGVGPLGKAAAERLRAELLRKQQPATIANGDDHAGAPILPR